MRAIAAPGRLSAPDLAAFNAEIARAKVLAPTSRILAATQETMNDQIIHHLLPE
jgi:hypothetical protein